MNIEKLEESVRSIVTKLDESSFIYDLLLAYGQPKASISRLKKGDYNRSKNPGEIVWKKKLAFKHETDADLHAVIDQMQNDPDVTKHHPRFIIVTDFKTLLAFDTKTDNSLDTPIAELASHFDFFLPWAGLEKTQLQSENPADVKAAEKMGRLYDLILEENPPETEADRHALNIFLSRLLFCFFAEDTGIFDDELFTNSVASHTSADGSDLQPYLQKLFSVLNTEDRSKFPAFLQKFPYVNGGLFADEYPVPTFDAKSRKIIIECGGLNWKAINPDIFGSMIQAVVHPDQRGGLGMHYTSVVNIMKVIEPLFLNDLQAELEKAGTSKKKLQALLERLYRLRIFDPACGSGNFLIIAYKELCRLEIEIFKRMYGDSSGIQTSFRFENKIQLTQFYGIEIDDFAHETAKLSLWLTEHQMNIAFREVFGSTRPTLPLQDGGYIVCGNATRLDWEEVCPKGNGAEIYLLGNPPYQGSKKQSKSQKEELARVFQGSSNYKNLDYISCWIAKSSNYILDSTAVFSFVATNSIVQGDHVALLWPHIFRNGQEISFAHQAFKWQNNARGNAGVECVVVGVRNKSNGDKWIYSKGKKLLVSNVSPYLIEGSNLIVEKRNSNLSHLPEMSYGNMPLEGNYLKLNSTEKEALINEDSRSADFIRPLVGGKEFLNGIERWCLWIEDADLKLALSIPGIAERIKNVRKFRESGGEVARTLVARSHQFRYRHQAKKTMLVVPCTSSQNREYMQCGYFDDSFISLNSVQVLYDREPHLFAIISSRIHMCWVKAVAGRMKSDYRYSSALCYNTFPFPRISENQKAVLEEHVYKILDQREIYSEKTLAELYDPKKMPDGLRKAHLEMDLAVEQCYRKKPFTSDEERLEYLFKLYEEMIEAEQSKEVANA